MGIGFGQVLILLVIILILFGAGKLPKVMKDLAKGMKAFKEGLNEGEEAEKKSLSQLPKAKKTAHITAPKKAAVRKKAS